MIELRLRTDDYGGFRDYKTVRRTAIHELVHNVHSDHDRKFWDLYKTLEKEVQQADWTAGGHQLNNGAEYYDPGESAGYLGDSEDVHDEGGWTGGEFVLGGKRAQEAGEGLTRREILAKAAEERMKKKAR